MVHLHEKIDFTASVYIVSEGKILLHMHKKLGRWLPPGGHIELDEGPEEAALREAKEETGLDVELVGITSGIDYSDGSRDIILPFAINRHRFNETHEHIDFVYFGNVMGGEVHSEHGEDIRWFSKEEIESAAEVFPPAVLGYCLSAIEKLKK